VVKIGKNGLTTTVFIDDNIKLILKFS